ncbi:MAG TPA: glycosyltransferase [Anaerolineales bacterium]|nr:glycosyltransferase [Anaerolineales bacterium]
MNLLFLTPTVPFPPDQGTAIRNWGLISSLAGQHHISLLTFANRPDKVAPELRDCCATILVASPPARTPVQRLATLLGSSRPDLADRLVSTDFSTRLQKLLKSESFDAVHVEGLELASYLQQIAAQRGEASTPLLVYDAHNAETVIQRRAFQTDRLQPHRWFAALYSRLQLPRLARLERHTCALADTVLCVSAEDRAALREMLPGLHPMLLPNGIFLDDYPTTVKPAGLPAPALVFSGKMDYRPNVDAVLWFAREILPRVRKTHVETTFVVAGKAPVPRVQRLAENPGITVTGPVPDVRPYIAAATVYVIPLRMGGGTRFKMLEGMALRRPIVSTTIGAEGFPVANGRELLLADSADEQASAICSLIDDAQTRARLGMAGRAFVEARYQWSAIVPRMQEVYQRTRG